MLAAAHDRQGCDKTQTHERQGCEAKEDSPAAIATTLGQEILGELLEQAAFDGRIRHGKTRRNGSMAPASAACAHRSQANGA